MVNKAFAKLINYLRVLFIKSNVKMTVGTGLVLKGKPIIDIRNEAKIIIGNNVVLNSKNYGYHVSMHSPVKLFADRSGANISIGSDTRIHGSCIHAYSSITIGGKCLIAANCQIFDGNGHDLCLENPSERIYSVGKAKPIVIEDNVWLGINCIVLPGVTIGQGSVVAAGSVVSHNIPPQCLVAGNPAKVIKQCKV